MAKTLIYQIKAEQDVEQAIDYYREKSKVLGNKFYHELMKSYGNISDHPAIGSNRFAYELNIPNLKTWRSQIFLILFFTLRKPNTFISTVFCIVVDKFHHGCLNLNIITLSNGCYYFNFVIVATVYFSCRHS